MKLHRFLPLLALLGLACKSEDATVTGAALSRPVPTAEEQAGIDQALAGQKIGALINDKTSWFKGNTYQKGGLDRAPELYLFYFSASW